MDNIWHTNKEEPITYTYIVFKFNTPFGDDIDNQEPKYDCFYLNDRGVGTDIAWNYLEHCDEWCYLDDLIYQVCQCNDIIETLIKGLNFYATGKHIYKDTETLKYAMMNTNDPSARIIERIADRGEYAQQILNEELKNV